jgi:hypothetical protein
MSLLIAAHFLKSWNQMDTATLIFQLIDHWGSSTMCCILQLIVLLDKGTFESSFTADTPIIMFTISTAAGRMSSSVILWGFLHFAILCATFVRC